MIILQLRGRGEPVLSVSAGAVTDRPSRMVDRAAVNAEG